MGKAFYSCTNMTSNSWMLLDCGSWNAYLQLISHMLYGTLFRGTGWQVKVNSNLVCSPGPHEHVWGRAISSIKMSNMSHLTVNDRQNLDSSVSKICHRFCLVHPTCSLAISKRAYRWWWVNGICIHGLLERRLPSCRHLWAVSVETWCTEALQISRKMACSWELASSGSKIGLQQQLLLFVYPLPQLASWRLYHAADILP